MLRFGVAAIFGPQSEASSDHVHSMCQSMKIPYIQTRWGPKRSPSSTNSRIGNNPGTSVWPNTKATVNNPLSINLHPHPASLSRVRFMSQSDVNRKVLLIVACRWTYLYLFICKLLCIICWQAYSDVVQGWKWKSFTVLYEDEEGLIRLEDLLQLSTMPGYRVIVRQLPSSDDYR
jgi:hypothetical protein